MFFSVSRYRKCQNISVAWFVKLYHKIPKHEPLALFCSTSLEIRLFYGYGYGGGGGGGWIKSSQVNIYSHGKKNLQLSYKKI